MLFRSCLQPFWPVCLQTNNFKLAFSIIPAVILAVAVIAAIAYSLTKEKYALLLTAAEAKENGVEYRVEGLDRVL